MHVDFVTHSLTGKVNWGNFDTFFEKPMHKGHNCMYRLSVELNILDKSSDSTYMLFCYN